MAELAPEELRTLIALAKKALWADRATRSAIQQAGLHVVPSNFYSSTPSIDDVEHSFEYAAELDGIAPYLDGGLYCGERVRAFVESLLDFAREFSPPEEGDRENPEGYFWGNPAFSRSDAMAYYCMIRALKPRRVIEIGAGFSTLVAEMAIKANGTGEIVVIEPYPRAFLRQLDSVAEIIEKPVQSIPVDDLVALVESAQIWFIDSTHTVKAGSDCLYIYLKIMPRIRTEVVCHTHDVFMPYGMPPVWALDRNIFWTEQYLLHAYLLDNPKAEVLYGSHFVAKTMPDLCEKFMCGRYLGGGGSLWYRLNGGQRTD